MGLKFMKRAEQNPKEMLKQQALMLIEQIQEDQDILNSDKEEAQTFLKSSSKFSNQAMAIPVIDDEVLKRAVQKLQGNDEEQVIPVVQKSSERSAVAIKSSLKSSDHGKKQKAVVEVTFDAKEDLKGFNTEQKRLITISKEDQTLRNLFITQDESEAIEEFEKIKEDQVVNELGKKVEVPKVARGWNEWAGDGVNESGF